MAKLLVEVDTEARTMSVSLDGQLVPDVCCAYVYNYSMKEPHFELVSSKESDGVQVNTRVMASQLGNDIVDFLAGN